MAFEKLQFVAISTLIHSSPSLRLCCIMIAKNEKKNFSYAMLMQRKNIIFHLSYFHLCCCYASNPHQLAPNNDKCIEENCKDCRYFIPHRLNFYSRSSRHPYADILKYHSDDLSRDAFNEQTLEPILCILHVNLEDDCRLCRKL